MLIVIMTHRWYHTSCLCINGCDMKAKGLKKTYNYIITHHKISVIIAPLVKLAVVSKTGVEASFLQKLACFSSSSLHSSRKTAISHVY